ncbi:MAG TPA: EVE domain-containing protein [Opitutaceae bacterium]|jgi:predicted RNA-binding protein with PUA-like domain
MKSQCWLVKQEPESYAWDDFVRDGKTAWEGVRSFAARLHLNGMQKGDRVLFYASGGPKCVVGTALVSKTAFPDATADEPGWVAVELKADRPLPRPVTLAEIKADARLKNLPLIRQSRLSVMPVSPVEFDRILALADKTPART